jgi:hypothetical protein
MFFGGDYNQWSFRCCWFMLYLDLCYHNIVSHVGLLQFLPQCGYFRDKIEEYCQKNWWYHNHQGNITWVPGLEKSPYNIFGWIDDSIDQISVPFLGPAGNDIGAPCQVQYVNAQELVYSGWKSLHGIKVETVLLPIGMSTVFGPVSARQNNRGTLNLSGLNCILALIQASLPPHCRCMLFGDSIFCGLLQYITTYYRAIAPNVLLAKEVKINATFRAAWMPIEKNYGLTNCVFRNL